MLRIQRLSKAASILSCGVCPSLATRSSATGNWPARIRTQPTRRLWLYRLGESGPLGRRIRSVFTAGSAPPARFDQGLLDADLDRLRVLYHQEGFREAEVEATVDSVGIGEVAVTFHIVPRSPTYVRNVEYTGVDHLAVEQHVRLARGTLLRVDRVDRERPLHLRGRRQRYSETMMLDERRRLLSFLRDEGYATVTRDSIEVHVFTPAPDSFDLRFVVIGTGPRYAFGDLAFDILGPETEMAMRTDTVAMEAPSDSVAGGIASFRFRYEGKLTPGLLTRTLQFAPGDWYSQSAVLATRQRLEGTGVFLFTDFVPGEGIEAGEGAAPRLSHRVDLRTRSRHQIRLETFNAGAYGHLGEFGHGVRYGGRHHLRERQLAGPRRIVSHTCHTVPSRPSSRSGTSCLPLPKRRS